MVIARVIEGCIGLNELGIVICIAVPDQSQQRKVKPLDQAQNVNAELAVSAQVSLKEIIEVDLHDTHFQSWCRRHGISGHFISAMASVDRSATVAELLTDLMSTRLRHS